MSEIPVPLRPWLAAILSLVIPGAGELYCGERRQGVLVLIASIVLLWLCGLAPVLSAINAWRIAARKRWRRVEVGRGGGGDLPDLGDALDLLD